MLNSKKEPGGVSAGQGYKHQSWVAMGRPSLPRRSLQRQAQQTYANLTPAKVLKRFLARPIGQVLRIRGGALMIAPATEIRRGDRTVDDLLLEVAVVFGPDLSARIALLNGSDQDYFHVTDWLLWCASTRR